MITIVWDQVTTTSVYGGGGIVSVSIYCSHYSYNLCFVFFFCFFFGGGVVISNTHIYINVTTVTGHVYM